ncbi:hypothetical protein ACK1M2_002158 [Providencia rettgeri]|uniref:hypothetical protein n=1 Tax=Providencia sp. PROV148 TaxID=2949858 RepID=UPI00234BB43D|nr:hypothetical protein [Providencia sp. PROV148]
MAFDWIAGTALVVGVGSLYLTYQSTKSAKRAIETSIELYEKQKQDAALAEEVSKKNQMQSLCLLIQNEVSENKIKMIKLVEFCESACDKELVVFNYNDLGSEPFVAYELKSGSKDGFIFTKHSCQVIDKYLLEVSKIDNKLITGLLKLRYSIEHYNNKFLISLANFIQAKPDIDELSKYINDSKYFITEYQKQSMSVLKYCAEKTLELE